jgi:hypothetical protein
MSSAPIMSYFKFSYHLIAFIFLCFVSLVFHLPQYVKTILLVFAFVNLYDCWWFYNNMEPPPTN